MAGYKINIQKAIVFLFTRNKRGNLKGDLINISNKNQKKPMNVYLKETYAKHVWRNM